jgi:mannose-6-phosphate isomerase-like protein (cupin superfamily)
MFGSHSLVTGLTRGATTLITAHRYTITEGRTMTTVVNIADKFSRFQDYWSPKLVAECNGQHLKLVKLKGEFVAHTHDNEDELFLVIDGALRIRLPDQELRLGAGEFVVIPRGVRHQPIADQEARVLLLEPAGTLNTGDADDERTVPTPDRI